MMRVRVTYRLAVLQSNIDYIVYARDMGHLLGFKWALYDDMVIDKKMKSAVSNTLLYTKSSIGDDDF